MSWLWECGNRGSDFQGRREGWRTAARTVLGNGRARGPGADSPPGARPRLRQALTAKWSQRPILQISWAPAAEAGHEAAIGGAYGSTRIARNGSGGLRSQVFSGIAPVRGLAGRFGPDGVVQPQRLVQPPGRGGGPAVGQGIGPGLAGAEANDLRPGAGARRGDMLLPAIAEPLQERIVSLLFSPRGEAPSRSRCAGRPRDDYRRLFSHQPAAPIPASDASRTAGGF